MVSDLRWATRTPRRGRATSGATPGQRCTTREESAWRDSTETVQLAAPEATQRAAMLRMVEGVRWTGRVSTRKTDITNSQPTTRQAIRPTT